MAKLKATSFKNKTILKILDYYKTIWAIGHVSAVNHWDLETYMPPLGATARGEALAKLSTLSQKFFLDPAFAKLIASAGAVKTLNDEERSVVRVLTHSLKFYEKLPPNFLEEFEKLTNTATVVWRKARDTNNYKLFEPYLSKIFDMNKKAAEYLGYKNSPYDALLDQFEEGLESESVNQLFSKVKKPLKDLLTKIIKSPKYAKDHPLENQKYDKNKMQALNEKVLKTFWPEYGQNFRLDVSAHPFTTSFSNQDTRITTWYHEVDFARSLLATVHEFGHALYDLQSDPNLEMTPIGGGSSLVIHESQSRFWENFIGRSESFIQEFLSDFCAVTNNHKLSTNDYFSYFNQVKPSLLRVEADEVTYHFHIMLRYEIEKMMIEGRLKIKDLREIWNAKMKEYLGMSPRSDSDGVLQDIHWSSGMVGYFPTYSLGTFLGAQWEEKITQNSKLKTQNFNLKLKTIKNYLKEHIHKFGSTYTLEELLKKNKMKFDPSVNLKYLKEKYSKIYDF